MQTLRAGGAGCISATANVNGAAIAASATAWREPGADERQAALDRVRAAFQKRPMIAAMKAAIATGTGDEGWSRVRPPLVELDAAARRGLDADLDAVGYVRPTLDT